MLRLQLLSHGKRGRTLIKSLVRSDCHFNFISDSQEEEAALGLAERYLSDDFIKGLRK